MAAIKEMWHLVNQAQAEGKIAAAWALGKAALPKQSLKWHWAIKLGSAA